MKSVALKEQKEKRLWQDWMLLSCHVLLPDSGHNAFYCQTSD